MQKTHYIVHAILILEYRMVDQNHSIILFLIDKYFEQHVWSLQYQKHIEELSLYGSLIS
jgi:hypothetical protein